MCYNVRMSGRILLEVSEPALHGLRGGVGRVTAKLLEHAPPPPEVAPEVAPVVWTGDGFGAWRPPEVFPPPEATAARAAGTRADASRSVARKPADTLADASCSVASLIDLAKDPLRPWAWRGKARRWRRTLTPANVGAGDTLLLLAPAWAAPTAGTLRRVTTRGAAVVGLIHDLLPVSDADTCDPATARWFPRWLDAMLPVAPRWLSFSQATRTALLAYAAQRGFDGAAAPQVTVVPPGSDFSVLHPSSPIPHPSSLPAVEALIQSALSGPLFLCVGTIEPRKQHAVVLDAFEQVVQQMPDAHLLLVGRAGWRCEAVVQRIEQHPLLGKRLHWPKQVSDEQLAAAYRCATATIAASRAEGFDLPVVESLACGTPVIASDIAVHREVAGERGRYVPSGDAAALAAAMRELPAGGRVEPLRWPNWAESAQAVFAALRARGEGSSE